MSAPSRQTACKLDHIAKQVGILGQGNAHDHTAARCRRSPECTSGRRVRSLRRNRTPVPRRVSKGLTPKLSCPPSKRKQIARSIRSPNQQRQTARVPASQLQRLVRRPTFRSGLGNSKLTANAAGGVIVYVAMSWHGSLLLVGWIHPHGMTAPLAQQFTALPTKVLHQILSLHEATSPAGVCSTSLLALRCR
jgi:hypothetical protein